MEIAEPLPESSDPCGLMRKKVLNLSPDAFRGREEEQKGAGGYGSCERELGEGGVGYVTPP